MDFSKLYYFPELLKPPNLKDAKQVIMYKSLKTELGHTVQHLTIDLMTNKYKYTIIDY
jgi:hypothetical protein